jgi:outer membrane protein OmpA-like peptidoglycan-associated protein
LKRGHLSAALCFFAAAAVLAADPPAGTPVSFLACPVARDTGPDTDLCFFAEYEGNRYALVNPPDWGVPQLKHRVLVEGRVKEGPGLCGAIPIEGRASVIAEIDENCNLILPFDDVIKGAAGGVFNSGTPQQRAFAQDLARRVALDPNLSVEPAIADPAPAPLPTPPFEQRTLVIIYPFDSDRGSGPDMVKLKDLVTFIKVANARSVRVVGFRATSRLSSGSDITEGQQIAENRATKIASILGGLGVNAKLVHVNWQARAIDGNGDGDWRNRKVEITVEP